MIPREEAFLAAIVEDPDDDTPRLVYADWLDEHDQPERAEFIRLQIELTRLTEYGEESRRLYLRERELLSAHREQWAAQIGLVDSERGSATFTRGLVDGLELKDGAPADLDVLARVPGLRRLGLDAFTLTPAAVRKIAALPNLDVLTICDAPFRRQWFKLLEPLPCGTVLRIYPKGEQ